MITFFLRKDNHLDTLKDKHFDKDKDIHKDRTYLQKMTDLEVSPPDGKASFSGIPESQV